MAENQLAKQLEDYLAWKRYVETTTEMLIGVMGEAEFLKLVASTDLKAHLRDYTRLHLIVEDKLPDKLKPQPSEDEAKAVEFLVKKLVHQATVFAQPFYWSLFDGSEEIPPDLGKKVPKSFLKALLREPHPFALFWSTLSRLEAWQLVWEEKDRRAKALPDKGVALDAVMEYREALNPLALAVGFLRRMTFKERASLAMHYGLENLAWLEEELAKGVESSRDGERNRLRDKGASHFAALEGSTPLNAALRDVQAQFPNFETEFADEIAKNMSLPDSRQLLAEAIKDECALLAGRIAGNCFGYDLDRSGEALDRATVKAMSPDLQRLARGHHNPGRIHSQIAQEQGFGDVQSSLWEALNSYAKKGKSADDILIEGLKGKISAYFRIVVSNNLVNITRKETPEFTREWKAKLERHPVHDGLERRDLLERFKEEFYWADAAPGQMKRRRFTSFDSDLEDEEGNTHSTEQAVPDPRSFHSDETYTDEDSVEWINKRRLLREAVERAPLTERERLVLELHLQDSTYKHIALTYEERFGKPCTEVNVRKHCSRAVKKVIQELLTRPQD